MEKKKYLTKKNIIIFSIIVFIILGICLVYYLSTHTIIFKDNEEIKSDVLSLQNDVKNNGKKSIDNDLYNKDIGVSEETLYIKENASDKLKESVQGTDIGMEKRIQSKDGMIILEPYVGTSITGYNILSHTKDSLTIQAYSYDNLCNLYYIVGSVTDEKMVEEGKDELGKAIIAPNMTYTLNSNIETTNTVFFFDKDMKFISSTKEKVFTTPQQAKYIKVISNGGTEGENVDYCLTLGENTQGDFKCDLTQTVINVNGKDDKYLPFYNEKTVIYIDGGEIELKYVVK